MLLCAFLVVAVSGCVKEEKKTLTIIRQGWITDYAEIIPQEDKTRISATLAAYEKETCHQVLVLVVPSLAGESMEAFSQRVASDWDIGQPGFGNGLLVSIAMQEGSIRIEANSAFDWLINEGVADTVLKEMLPYFKKERYVEGIERGLAGLMQAARVKVFPEDHKPEVCRHDS